MWRPPSVSWLARAFISQPRLCGVVAWPVGATTSVRPSPRHLRGVSLAVCRSENERASEEKQRRQTTTTTTEARKEVYYTQCHIPIKVMAHGGQLDALQRMPVAHVQYVTSAQGGPTERPPIYGPSSGHCRFSVPSSTHHATQHGLSSNRRFSESPTNAHVHCDR